MRKKEKVMLGLQGILLALICSTLVMGCDLDSSQIKVIAQNAGLFSAVGWIAVDNPDQEALKSVNSVLGVIREKSSSVQSGNTYTETLYPELEKVINADVDIQYRPIALAGSISLLGGIDMLFATHSEWKEDQDLAISIVNSFILGAQGGLSMGEKEPLMIQVRSQALARSRVLK